MIIRAKSSNETYQFSSYEPGWIFEVMNDYGDFYTAKVLTGGHKNTDNVVAVHKEDCELIIK